MLKREELAIAKVLRALRDSAEREIAEAERNKHAATRQIFGAVLGTVDEVSKGIARELSGGRVWSKAFDRERFLIACGWMRKG